MSSSVDPDLVSQAQRLVEEARADDKAEGSVELLTVKEYADRYRLHVQTVYASIRRGKFKLPIVRDTDRAIRIVVSRGSIQTRKSA